MRPPEPSFWGCMFLFSATEIHKDTSHICFWLIPFFAFDHTPSLNSNLTQKWVQVSFCWFFNWKKKTKQKNPAMEINKSECFSFAVTFTEWTVGLSVSRPAFQLKVISSLRLFQHSELLPMLKEKSVLCGVPSKIHLIFVLGINRRQRKKTQPASNNMINCKSSF